MDCSTYRSLIALLSLSVWPLSVCLHPQSKTLLRDQEAMAIGMLVWRNECKGTVEGLTSWNQGEEFASLGIGHFIWYPEGKSGPFQESFPNLISFLRTRNIPIPSWLSKHKGCPWQSRDEFLAAQHSDKMIQLRTLLANTIAHQIVFMARRLDTALAKLLNTINSNEKKIEIATKFKALASCTSGRYALLDYLNFKGEGLKPSESYQGHRWGLLQVLETMQSNKKGSALLEEFACAAKKVLQTRVQNAPPERHEERWIPGWFNRIDTYKTAVIRPTDS